MTKSQKLRRRQLLSLSLLPFGLFLKACSTNRAEVRQETRVEGRVENRQDRRRGWD